MAISNQGVAINIVADAASALNIPVTITSNGSAYVWSGTTVTASIYTDTNRTVAATVSTFTWTNGVSGAATMALTAAQVATLGVGKFYYRINANIGGTATAWVTGIFVVSDEPGIPSLGLTITLSTSSGATASLTTIGYTLAQAASVHLNVKDYGAVGDGVTDDTTAIQAALTAVPSAGATVFFPVGNYLCASGGLTCANPVHLVGAGGHGLEGGGSRIRVTSATAQCLTLSGPRWHMTDMVLENTGSSTPSNGGGLLAVDADYSRTTRCMFIGFYNNAQMGGFYWSITDSAFFNAVNYGLYLLAQSGEYDNGDQIIHGCVFSKIGDGTKGSGNGGTALRWESGGGLKFIGNKINGGTAQVGYASSGKWDGGIRCYAADGISTSGITINDNNIENCTTIGIEVKLSGGANTGVLSKITIANNAIGINGSGISISPQVVNKISVVSIAGNVMTNLSTGIFLQNVRGVSIGRNIHNTVTTPVSLTTTLADIQCDPQLQVQDNANIIIDGSYSSAARGAGLATFRDDRDIISTTSTVTYTRLWTIATPLNSGGILTLRLGGFVTGQAAFAVMAQRSWTRGGSGAVTCATIGTDQFVGTLVDINFDTTTTSGSVIVGVKLNVAGGTDVFGRASLIIEGPTGTLKKGT